MSQKIWVIDDQHEKPVTSSLITGRGVSVVKQKNAKIKNPALAYSLSLLIWGCGQFYNKQWKHGILYLLLMINFYTIMSITIMYWEFVKRPSESCYFSCSGTLILCGIFYLSGLIIWYFNAWQAYFKTAKMHAASFKGIKIMLLPVICSLLMPGWGQLLNGQAKKGIFFQCFALAGLMTFPAIVVIFRFWPALEPSQARLILEWIFTICIMLVPFILVIWLLSVIDAAKVSIDMIKKEPLPKRIKYAINRFRHNIQIYGLKNAMLPLLKRIVLTSVLLVFCVISYHYFPQKYYIQQLQNWGNRMSQNEMTVTPGLIHKLLANNKRGK